MMTFNDKQVLSAKLSIAQNQAMLEANDLEKQAEKSWHEAFLARERCCLLADAIFQLWQAEQITED